MMKAVDRNPDGAGAPAAAPPAGPRYRQIAQELLGQIAGGTYPKGAMLPAEAELCEIFGASRFTIREALRWLAEHGIIDRRRGAGTKVLSAKPATAFIYRLSSVAEILKYPTDTYRENMYMGLIHADPELANKIDCPIGKEWFRISGLRRSDKSDLPISWSDIYVLPELAGALGRDKIGREPVFELLERQAGVSIFDAEIRFFASSVDRKLAQLLEVAEATPALSIVRRYLDEDGRNFETTVTVHPEKRFEYSMRLHRDRILAD